VASRVLKQRATYEDLLDLPEHLVGEILDGDLYASPRPALPHARVSSALEMEIGGPFDRGRGGPGGWWILFEPELHLGAEVLVPDLAGWRRDRLPLIPDAAFMTLAPDWVCEVLSPSTERIDRVLKLPIYAKYGVGHAWLVNPASRTLEVYRLSDAAWTLIASHGDDAVVRAEPFDAVELDLLVLWGESRSSRER
jgi:Uma2 family endonuclease